MRFVPKHEPGSAPPTLRPLTRTEAEMLRTYWACHAGERGEEMLHQVGKLLADIHALGA